VAPDVNVAMATTSHVKKSYTLSKYVGVSGTQSLQ